MITAVMFVFNEEKFISTQLDSILNQSVKVDKVVVIDDQSTDSTSYIIKNYQKKHPHILYFVNPDKGKVNAYKLGLTKVDTKWFFICAGDDYLFENYVETQLQYLQNKKLKYIFAKYIITDGDLKPVAKVIRKDRYSFEDLLKSNRVSGYYFASSEVITFIKDIPQKFGFEDWLTSLILSYNFGEAYMSEVPLFYYRRHSNSTTKKLNNLGVRKRDISFVNNLLAFEGINLSVRNIELLKKRLDYYYAITGSFRYKKACKLLFSKSLIFSEKVRLSLHFLPFIKNDNDVEKILEKLLRLINLRN